jgi:hypothetical protein
MNDPGFPTRSEIHFRNLHCALQLLSMKTIIILLLFLSINASAQISPWTGRFDGAIIGINATITAEAAGPEWTADINASGYPLSLSGIITGNACSGTMSDAQTQSSSSFTATLDGAQLVLSIRDINPLTGLEEDMHFTFMKTASVSGGMSQTAKVTVYAANIDEALVGSWRFTDSYVSSGFSVATDYFMRFDGDGTVYVTDGRSAGGDANASFDSGSGDVHQGTWKVENKVLYMNDGTSGWQPYATYYAEEYRMMLTYNNGKKQVWERL